jgi:hypothetical protein
MSKKKEKDDITLSGMDRYIRSLWSSLEFPSVDVNGGLFITTTSGLTGRASKNNRKFLHDGSSVLKKHMGLHFPQGALHTVMAPEDRALKWKQDTTQTTVASFFAGQKASYVPSWTDKTMALAAREFEVPANTRILMMCPEIFDREILLEDPKFRVEYKDANGISRIGVKTPCPWCESNVHVSFKDKSGLKQGQHRTIADFRARIPIYCYILECSNPDCIGDPKKAKGDGTDKVSKHSFHCYEPHVYQNYPAKLLEKYSTILYTDARDGKDGGIFVTETLCSEILRDETNYSELTRHMHDAYERNLRQTIEAYVRFIKQQSPTDSSAWPDFDETNFQHIFKPPSTNTIKVIFDCAFQLVFPYLKKDLFSRVPGGSLKFDGTFQFLKKTINDGLSETETKCLHVVWGEYGHIVSWAFDGSENDLCFMRLNGKLRDRCKMIDPKHVLEVKYAHSDVCCQGNSDPTQHWITAIWPNCPRAPYKDAFHCAKRLGDATQPHHPLSDTFSKMIGQCFIQYSHSSALHVAQLYMKKSKQKLAPEMAKEKALEKIEFRRKIKNYAPNRIDLEKSLEETYKQIERQDQQMKAEAELEGNGYLSFILKEKKGVRLGTRRELDNILTHVRKGCCEDPVSIDKINVALDPEVEFPDYIRLRGTSQGESTNRLINKLTNDIGQQTAETADKRLWLRVTRYNLEKDRVMQKVLGLKKIRSMEWYLHQAVLQQHPKISAYANLQFPDDIPEDYEEPIGIEYGRWKKWNDTEILSARSYELSANNRTTSSPDQELQDGTEQESQMLLDETGQVLEPEMPPLLQDQLAINIGASTAATEMAAPMAISASTTESNVVAAPMASTVASPNRSQRPPDFYAPQNNWSRSLKPMTAHRVTVANTYLVESTKLTPYQNQAFYQFLQTARTFHGGEQANPEHLPSRIMEIWNTRHFQLLGENDGIGLGGLIRLNHVKAILRTRGNAVRAAQAGGSNPPPTRPPRTLKREDIDKLSFRDARPWVLKIGTSVYNTLPQRKEQLKKHFDGKPADYVLSL